MHKAQVCAPRRRLVTHGAPSGRGSAGRKDARGGRTDASREAGGWEQLERALKARVDGEVRFDDGSRAAYSTDASNFRQVPLGVVIPRHPEAAVEAVAVCREHQVPLLSRGGGTSLAGQCTNAAVVLDWSKYCSRLVSVDADARRCVVEPGIVLDELNRRLAPTGSGTDRSPPRIRTAPSAA